MQCLALSESIEYVSPLVSSVSLIIPAYNAAQTLPTVLQRIPSSFYECIKSIWIIDDGSSDATATVIATLQDTYPNIKPIILVKNGGYGAAMCCGLQAVQQEGSAFAICLHADGQYAPEKLPDMLAAAQKETYDIVQGSRHAHGGALAGGMPYYKYVAGTLLSLLENMIFGLRLTDYHSGYLLYSNNALKKIPFATLSASFDFDLEVIASARARTLRIGEIAIPTQYANEVSYLNPLTYGLRILKVLSKYLLGKYL